MNHGLIPEGASNECSRESYHILWQRRCELCSTHEPVPEPTEKLSKPGKDAGRRFIDSLKMFYHVANIGDARSLAIHPASTTHSQLTPEEQLQTGVTDGYVRLSLGIEHEDDIVADLKQALDAA